MKLKTQTDRNTFVLSLFPSKAGVHVLDSKIEAACDERLTHDQFREAFSDLQSRGLIKFIADSHGSAIFARTNDSRSLAKRKAANQ